MNKVNKSWFLNIIHDGASEEYSERDLADAQSHNYVSVAIENSETLKYVCKESDKKCERSIQANSCPVKVDQREYLSVFKSAFSSDFQKKAAKYLKENCK